MLIRNINIGKMIKLLEELSQKSEKVDIELDSETNELIFHITTNKDKKVPDQLPPSNTNNNDKIDLSDITKRI